MLKSSACSMSRKNRSIIKFTVEKRKRAPPQHYMFSEGQGKRESFINFKEVFKKEDNMGVIISLTNKDCKRL